MEHHGGGLTDTVASTLRLFRDVNHPALRSGWQTMPGLDPDGQRDALRALMPHLFCVHVFQWLQRRGLPDVRYALADGESEWRSRLELVRNLPVYALIEYVKNDTPEQFLADAALLKTL